MKNYYQSLGLAYREEQPERRIHFAPGAIGNPEGVSYKPEPEAEASPW